MYSYMNQSPSESEVHRSEHSVLFCPWIGQVYLPWYPDGLFNYVCLKIISYGIGNVYYRLVNWIISIR